MSAKLMTKSKKKSGARTAAAWANATAAEASAKEAKVLKTKSDVKPKRLSALDAPAQVLKAVGKPMRAQEPLTTYGDRSPISREAACR